ncbi:Lactoylglutathione lyase [Caulobacter sp. RHG1]|nr:Lactoylglutathione lyase [Caulobacter sp. RHG1]
MTSPMISYVTIGASDPDRAGDFYDAVLGALGHARLWRQDHWIGYGPNPEHATILLCKPENGQPTKAGNGIMIGLRAETEEQVCAAHAAALAHGGSSEGEPGPRPVYGEGYYLAYVRDPDGNKLSICKMPHG